MPRSSLMKTPRSIPSCATALLVCVRCGVVDDPLEAHAEARERRVLARRPPSRARVCHSASASGSSRSTPRQQLLREVVALVEVARDGRRLGVVRRRPAGPPRARSARTARRRSGRPSRPPRSGVCAVGVAHDSRPSPRPSSGRRRRCALWRSTSRAAGAQRASSTAWPSAMLRRWPTCSAFVAFGSQKSTTARSPARRSSVSMPVKRPASSAAPVRGDPLVGEAHQEALALLLDGGDRGVGRERLAARAARPPASSAIALTSAASCSLSGSARRGTRAGSTARSVASTASSRLSVSQRCRCGLSHRCCSPEPVRDEHARRGSNPQPSA